ncbi:MAG: hypothetical protein K6G90_06920 [Clostridia bacterium]|nr:hypothetical protein [Clostridia bacterium]
MAEIVDLVRSKYDVDIKKTDLFKLYKIKSPDITDSELETLLADRRAKWEQSVESGTNEKFVERDRAFLEKAPAFEAILRDPALRRKIYDFQYGKKGAQTDGEVSKFTKEFFACVTKTSKLNTKRVSFFFEYFPEEKKNKKSILEYLKTEYKFYGYSDKKSKKDEEAENAEETESAEDGGTAREPSFFVENLFARKTLLSLRKSEIYYEKSRASDAVVKHYPALKDSMYAFLELDQFDDYEEFRTAVKTKRTAINATRQEFGAEFIPIVDFINSIDSVLGNNDIRNNFREFKLLTEYPALTPYMYVSAEISKNGLDALYQTAGNNYRFLNLNDFLLTYFIPIYDNFGLSVQSIRPILKDAGKNADKQKLLNAVENLFGFRKRKRINPKLRAVHYLTYWPIYIVYGVFRFFKLIFDNIKVVSIAVAVAIIGYCLFLGNNSIFSYTYASGGGWLALVAPEGLPKNNLFYMIMRSIEFILSFIYEHGAAGVLSGIFLWNAVSILHKKLDIVGIERTVDKIIDTSKARTEEMYEDYGDELMKKRLPGIILNIVVTIAVPAAIVLLFVTI